MKITFKRVLLVGLGFAIGGILEAQTPTIFSAIRVNNFSDLRGDIVDNVDGVVTVDDSFEVQGIALFDQAMAEIELTANDVTINGPLNVTGGCTGCGAGSSVPATVQGDTLFASAANTLTALAKDTNATRYLSNTGASNNPAWAQINLANGITGDLPFANLTQGSALSVLGVTGNATADFASIAAGSDFNILRRSGTALTFGAIDLSQSGAVGSSLLGAANGGLGFSTVTDDTVAVANGTIWQSKALTSCSAASSAVTYNTTTNAWGCNTISSGTPGGATTEIQFNLAGAFDGDPEFRYTSPGVSPTLFVGNSSGGANTFTIATPDQTGNSATSALTIKTGSAMANGQSGGNINITGGPAGFSGGTGGAVNLTAGDSLAGLGGSIAITSGSATVSGNNNGGPITLLTGNGFGSGVPGVIVLDGGGSTDEVTVSPGVVAMIGSTTGGASGGISMTPSSGTFVATFATACTTSPTVTFDYQAIGNIVTAWSVASSGWPCTSDSTSTISGADIPAAIRPATDRCMQLMRGVDGGVAVNTAVYWQANGSVNFLQLGAAGVTCAQSAAWTASLSKDMTNAGSEIQITYGLGNP